MTRFPVEATATTQNGGTVRVLPFATVTVKTPSEDLATLYAAATGSETLANPLITDGVGNYSFWLDLGTTYSVTFTKGAAGGSYFANSDYQDGPIIKALYEAEADTNAFTDAEQASVAASAAALGASLYATRTLFEAATIPASVMVSGWQSGDHTVMVHRSSGNTCVTSNGASVNWSPMGLPRPDHYAENTTPGTTDMATAIGSCGAANSEVYFFPTDYAVGSTVVNTSEKWQGAGHTGLVTTFARPRTRILGLSATLPVADPMVSLRRNATLLDLQFQYDAVTDSEGLDERVCLDVSGGGSDPIGRGGKIDRVSIMECGTCISQMGGMGFSCTYGTIYLRNYTYAAINFNGTSSGDYWENIYINFDFACTYTPEFIVNFEVAQLGVINQMNIEGWVEPVQYGLRFANTKAGVVNFLSFEGPGNNGANYDFIKLDSGATLRIDSLAIHNIRIYDAGCTMIKLGSAPNNGAAVAAEQAQLNIGNLKVNGLAWAEAAVDPGYADFGLIDSGNDTGFQFFGRDSSYNADQYHVRIEKYNYAVYAVTLINDAPIYKNLFTTWSNANNNIVISETPTGVLRNRTIAAKTEVPMTQLILEVLAPNGQALQYRRDATGTALTTEGEDTVNWSPDGLPRADHYAENTTPGTTNMAAAINTCLDNHGQCHLFAGQYAVGASISEDNCILQGVHSQGNYRTRLIGLSATLPIADAIVKIGRSSQVKGVMIEYDALTGSETLDQRVGLDTRGASFPLQRGSEVDNVKFVNVGTAISDYDGGAFSIHFGVIEIGSHSYAGVDLRTQAGTGNSWDNLYINGNNTYSAVKYGFNTQQGMFGSAQQINVEHQKYTGAAFRMVNCAVGHIASLHLEGVDVTAINSCYADFDQASVSIGTLGMINTGGSFDNLTAIRLNSTGFRLAGTAGQETTHNHISIGTLHNVGLSDPDATVHPTYSAGRRGLDKVVGFQFVGRDVAYTDSEYRIEIGNHEWGAYAGNPLAVPIYKYASSRHSNANGNIEILRWGSFGSAIRPPRNHLTNGSFDTFVNTSLTGVISATQLATGWFLASGTASIAGSRQFDTTGRDNNNFLRFTNVGTSATFQRLYTDITNVRPLLDADLCLQFEMRATVAGRRLEQITTTLTTGGSPATVTTQVINGTSSTLDALTTWRFYEFDFKISSSGVTFGASPTLQLVIQINAGSATRESSIDLRNVKLARRKGGSSYIR